MKRLMTLMLGLAFLVSTVTVSFAQDTKKEENRGKTKTKTKTKSGKKKKEETPKK